MAKNYKEIESALIHGGIYGDPLTGAVNVPIYQTSTYEQQGLGQNKGWEYSRTGNPTRAALEALIAELEGGTHGFAFASGMAASTAVLTLFKTGDKILISSNVYGGTFRVLDKIFKNFGINYSIEDTTDLKSLETKITADVKAIWIESPANPLLTITDLKAVAELAQNTEFMQTCGTLDRSYDNCVVELSDELKPYYSMDLDSSDDGYSLILKATDNNTDTCRLFESNSNGELIGLNEHGESDKNCLLDLANGENNFKVSRDTDNKSGQSAPSGLAPIVKHLTNR